MFLPPPDNPNAGAGRILHASPVPGFTFSLLLDTWEMRIRGKNSVGRNKANRRWRSAGLSIEKTNAYREKWGLVPLACLPETREVRGIVRFDQPGIVYWTATQNNPTYSRRRIRFLIS